MIMEYFNYTNTTLQMTINQYAERLLRRRFKKMENLGINIDKEYELIQQKKSGLSSNLRREVEYLHKIKKM